MRHIVIDAMARNLERISRRTLYRGSLTTLATPQAARQPFDVTDLIWKRASMKELLPVLATRGGMDHRTDRHLFITQSGAVRPIVAKTFPLAEAADALRYLVEAAPSAGSCSQSDSL